MEACNRLEKEFRISIIQFINWTHKKINNLCKNQEETMRDRATIKTIWKLSTVDYEKWRTKLANQKIRK